MLIQPDADLPRYHEDLLLVKVRPGGEAAASAAAVDVMPNFEGAPGLSTLSLYERAGFIKRLVPLSRSVQAPALNAFSPGSTMAGIAALAESPASERGTEGVSILELQAGADARGLQMALAQDASIEFVAQVPVRYLLTDAIGATATPPPGTEFWNLKKIGWSQARAAGLASAADVRIAVLDTGIDTAHPDLPQPLRYVHDYGLPVSVSDRDIVGHGTHVAGTICALVNNAIGVNGICDSSPVSFKIFGDQVKYIAQQQRYTFLVDPILYRAALAACVDEGIQVLNLSIGGYGEPDPVEKGLFSQLVKGGCTVVAAMGNDNTGIPSYPAAIPGVVAVGATSYDDTRASFSNFGAHISLCAPGVGIWSTLPTYPGRTGNYVNITSSGLPSIGKPIPREKDYAAWQGTSMASPHVAAAAALIIARHGLTSASDVRDRLLQATDRVPGMGTASFSPEYGVGRLNLQKAL